MKSLYVIKDLLANEVGPIIQAGSNEQAMRTFRASIKSFNPADYKYFKLFKIGEIDNVEGTLYPCDALEVPVNTSTEIG